MTTKNVKMCRNCEWYEGAVKGEAGCSNPAVNEKHPPFLVDGTHRFCLEERTNQAGLCGTAGKLFELADGDVLDERKRKYFRPQAD